ncbi:MAG: arginase [Bacteroidetes bacterium]|jgi:arginase|nr:arginase [Bacteroidota bacterium]
MTPKIKFIEAAFELGAGTPGAKLGPGALCKEILNISPKIMEGAEKETLIQDNLISVSSNNTPFAFNIHSIYQSVNLLAESVEKALLDGYFPIVISGDHSNAIGTVTGIADARPDKNIGVIWVDAHLDLHSPYTTPSGNMHGMAVKALLPDNLSAYRKNELNPETTTFWSKIKKSGHRGITPKILPQNIVFIGTRDFEEEEWSLIEGHNIRICTPDDIRKRGMKQILDEALEYLKNCDLLYTSFDVDSLDPTISMGTGTPSPDGLSYSDAELVFKTLLPHPKTAVFEISEINPLLDTDNSMPKTIAQLLAAAL